MHGATLRAPAKDNFEKLLDILHEEHITPISSKLLNAKKRTIDVKSIIEEDEGVWRSMDKKDAKGFNTKLDKVKTKLTKRIEAISKILAERAMEVTQRVNEQQCSERKKFLEILKVSSSNLIQIQRKWRSIIMNLTHERSIWHEPLVQPQTWVLDPTEGPGRERRRFVRRKARINAEFYKPETSGSKRRRQQIPLAYLFDVSKDFDSAELTKFRLHVNKKIDFSIRFDYDT